MTESRQCLFVYLSSLHEQAHFGIKRELMCLDRKIQTKRNRIKFV